jgi:SAM-dependent methyltransferase
VLARKGYARWVGVEPDERLCSVIEREIVDKGLIQNYALVRGTVASVESRAPFDTALYIDVLEHIEDDDKELARVAGLISPGGRVIIVSPAHNFLFSEFDRKIGHYRRYDKKSMRRIVPSSLEIEELFYLDSVGLFASLANRILLHSDNPTLKQVQLWDTVMVRLSRILDKLTFYRFGKTIVCVLRRIPA